MYLSAKKKSTVVMKRIIKVPLPKLNQFSILNNKPRGSITPRNIAHRVALPGNRGQKTSEWGTVAFTVTPDSSQKSMSSTKK